MSLEIVEKLRKLGRLVGDLTFSIVFGSTLFIKSESLEKLIEKVIRFRIRKFPFKLYRGVRDWYLPMIHEKQLIAKFKRYFGGVFVDVGAHVGTWILHLHECFDEIVAFEPHPKTFQNLLYNLKLNNIRNVKCYNLACGDFKGAMKLNLYKTESCSSFLTKHPTIVTNKKGEVIVKMIRLDDFNLKNVKLIKVDVEGWEVNVIKGALKTIKNNDPMLVIECHKKENLREIKKILPFNFDHLSVSGAHYLIHT